MPEPGKVCHRLKNSLAVVYIHMGNAAALSVVIADDDKRNAVFLHSADKLAVGLHSHEQIPVHAALKEKTARILRIHIHVDKKMVPLVLRYFAHADHSFIVNRVKEEIVCAVGQEDADGLGFFCLHLGGKRVGTVPIAGAHYFFARRLADIAFAAECTRYGRNAYVCFFGYIVNSHFFLAFINCHRSYLNRYFLILNWII